MRNTKLPVRAAQAGYTLVVHYAAIVSAFHSRHGHKQPNCLSSADTARYFWDIKPHADLRTKFYSH